MEENHWLLRARGPMYSVSFQIKANIFGTLCCVWNSVLDSGGQMSTQHIPSQVSHGEAVFGMGGERTNIRRANHLSLWRGFFNGGVIWVSIQRACKHIYALVWFWEVYSYTPFSNAVNYLSFLSRSKWLTKS